VPFDWDYPATWEKALRGIGAVYVNYHPDYAFPGAIENLSRFTRVAASCGIERLVILTGRGEHHAQLGEEVIAKSGLDYTIVRSAWFAQNFSEGSLWEPAMEGVVPMPGGDLEEPIIDIDDLADVIVEALTGAGHSGQTYECTGPRLLGFAEVADILSGAMGRRVDYLPISFEDFHAELETTSGTVFADIVTNIARETFDGRNAKRFQKITLGIGGITALAIGTFIALAPHAFYASYGIMLRQDPNLLNELRAPGAGLAVFGALMLAGIVRAANHHRCPSARRV